LPPRADNNGGRTSGRTTPGSSTPPLGSAVNVPLPKYEPQLSLTPYCNTKVIHFIRHGEGFHNVGYSNNLDAQLTERGWDQAHALGRHMYSQAPTSGVQLVVVSPLVRALETAAGVFGVDPSQCDLDPPTCLMAAQQAERNVRTAHGALALRPGLKFVAQELCRERLGEGASAFAQAGTCTHGRCSDAALSRGDCPPHPLLACHLAPCFAAGPSQCDKRQSLEDTQQQFPGVDFRCGALTTYPASHQRCSKLPNIAATSCCSCCIFCSVKCCWPQPRPHSPAGALP
jgi:hypothetical protein